jgi:hypothetical protein
MGQIPFTQYLLPNGERKATSIEMDDSISALADELIAKGYRFECEILTTSDVSLTCVDPEDTGDIAMVICKNGPDVPTFVEKLVRHAVEYDKTGVISGD